MVAADILAGNFDLVDIIILFAIILLRISELLPGT